MELKDNPHIQNITKILKDIGDRVEGNLICDFTPDSWTYSRNSEKIKNLQDLCKGKKKIIEIGVNACHSLLLMLMENPDAEYLLFDLNFHRYTQPALAYVKGAFPTAKIRMVYGNSVETIRAYIAENPHELNTYDFCHLDGGHTEDIFSEDYENMKKMVGSDGCVIFDDYDLHEIRRFITRKLAAGEIKEIAKNDKQFIYTYV